MHAHVLQHVPFEGLGSIEEWLSHRGARISHTRMFEPSKWPVLDEIDLLIVLGGPMSVNDEAHLPWLRTEKHLIAAAIAGGKAVLGICLGAQLIASALGARVYPGEHREIGWFPVCAAAAAADCFAFPARRAVFHWHGETFDLPPGAVHLASSAACRNQAFQLGQRVIALQFHLEVTAPGVAALISQCGDELQPNQPFIQSEAALNAVPASCYASNNALMASILEYLVGD